MKNYYVEVVETETDKVVKRMGPMSEPKAFKVQGGLAINMDHDNYYTRLVEAEEGQG